jgi:hypothetical protein
MEMTYTNAALPPPMVSPLLAVLVAYRSKTQNISNATSSTEVDFIAIIAAAKIAKYVRLIFH